MGAGSTQVTTQTTNPWKGQQQYLLKGFDKAEQLANYVPDYYPGETVAGFDPLQMQAQDATANYVTGPMATANVINSQQALADSLGGKTAFDPGQMGDLLAGNVRTGEGTPYQAMADALTGDVMSRLQGTVLPGLRTNQVAYQPGGSSRGDLENNKAIAGAVKQGMTLPLAQMYGDAYKTAQGQRLPAAQLSQSAQQIGFGAMPSIMATPLSLYGALNDVGAQRRAMTQATMDADMARYNYQANAPQMALANYMNMIQGNYGGQSFATSPGPSAMDQLGQAIGIAGSLAALSEMSMKENIVPEGTKWKGLNVYSFNYIGDNTPRRGVMAHQVEDMYPHAVVSIGGLRHVNYGAI